MDYSWSRFPQVFYQNWRYSMFEMAQLWVNLPPKYKMTKPGYQGIISDKIPVVSLPLGVTDTNDNGDNGVLGTTRVIARQLGETKSAAKTYSPVQVWDVNFPRLR